MGEQAIFALTQRSWTVQPTSIWSGPYPTQALRRTQLGPLRLEEEHAQLHQLVIAQRMIRHINVPGRGARVLETKVRIYVARVPGPGFETVAITRGAAIAIDSSQLDTPASTRSPRSNKDHAMARTESAMVRRAVPSNTAIPIAEIKAIANHVVLRPMPPRCRLQ